MYDLISLARDTEHGSMSVWWEVVGRQGKYSTGPEEWEWKWGTRVDVIGRARDEVFYIINLRQSERMGL